MARGETRYMPAARLADLVDRNIRKLRPMIEWAEGSSQFTIRDCFDQSLRASQWLLLEDGSVDATLSVLGAMFAPDHRRTADEMLRVTRSGGRIALASWTPGGFLGRMFRTVGRHVPPPAGVRSPVLWGTPEHLDELFAGSIASIRSQERECVWRFTSAEDLVAFFRRWYGPVLKAFENLDEAGKAALAKDLTELVEKSDRNRDGGSIAVPATYLETVITLR